MYVNIGATDRIHLCNIYYKCNITYIYIYIYNNNNNNNNNNIY